MIADLQDKVTLVTGSSRGIGAAIAKLFASAGAKVAVHGRDTSALSTVRADIERGGGRATQVVADVTKFAEVERMRQEVEQRLGATMVRVSVPSKGIPARRLWLHRLKKFKRMSKSKRRTSTATGAAVMKAIEAYTPDARRLFEDPIVARLLPAPARALIAVGPIRRWVARTIEPIQPASLGSRPPHAAALMTSLSASRRRRHPSSSWARGSTRAPTECLTFSLRVFEVDLPQVISE